jgi:hypothetical protein
MAKTLKLQLTFDDLPLSEHEALDPILAEIAKRKVVAAFFVRGREVEQKPAAVNFRTPKMCSEIIPGTISS